MCYCKGKKCCRFCNGTGAQTLLEHKSTLLGHSFCGCCNCCYRMDSDYNPASGSGHPPAEINI